MRILPVAEYRRSDPGKITTLAGWIWNILDPWWNNPEENSTGHLTFVKSLL